VPAERFEAYLDAERRIGVRYLGDTGRVEWLVSFAPIAPAELRAFVGAISSPVELDKELVPELAHGLTLALQAYAEMGFESFNLAIYGAPPATDGYQLNLRLACRSNLSAFYRSDSTFLERLHWEGAVDLPPEVIAERIGDRFRAYSVVIGRREARLLPMRCRPRRPVRLIVRATEGPLSGLGSRGHGSA
jgi:galactose-1-phosphate uridylyltransferase